MSQIEARIAKTGDHTFYVQKNNQSNLKGTLWGFGGVCGTAASFGCLAATAGSVATIAGKNLIDVFIPAAVEAINKTGLPVMPILCGATAVGIAASAVALKITGICFKNAIHNFGPDYEIVKTAEASKSAARAAAAAQLASNKKNKLARFRA